MFKQLIIVLGLLSIAACGGGDGSDGDNGLSTASIDPSRTYSLSALQSTAPGLVYATQLTGSDSDGATFSGSIAITNRARTMHNGALVTPQELTTNLTGAGISLTVTGTSYIDETGNLVSVEMRNRDLSCTPDSPDTMPGSVKVGDSGELSRLTCNDNTAEETRWRIEDAGSGNIRVISSGTLRNQSNSIVSVTDVIFTLDSSGNIIAFKTVSTQPASSSTLTYKSL